MRTCEFRDCGRKHYAKGLCRPHWKQKRRHGYMTFLPDRCAKLLPIDGLKPELQSLVRRRGIRSAARFLDMSDGQLYQILHYNRYVQFDTADRLCIALGLPFDAMFNKSVRGSV